MQAPAAAALQPGPSGPAAAEEGAPPYAPAAAAWGGSLPGMHPSGSACVSSASGGVAAPAVLASHSHAHARQLPAAPPGCMAGAAAAPAW
eukprot:CAMPEP_0202918222 /NCGR_PEP_ID=MMETSP1392-20130828/72929_1 /ASSEMBLY_ACC=CAM_ASM_000868 /TAXON_ID=225041 /ORGANISM="Chlamydomonas chlamydogama, Strain SAG 11-48b" /LENGTH=89 /DNA_ID=CAMNT_0049611219 /DNA_START=431 /DNA_END=697 /DNA_ORIENTATION=+